MVQHDIWKKYRTLAEYTCYLVINKIRIMSAKSYGDSLIRYWHDYESCGWKRVCPLASLATPPPVHPVKGTTSHNSQPGQFLRLHGGSRTQIIRTRQTGNCLISTLEGHLLQPNLGLHSLSIVSIETTVNY